MLSRKVTVVRAGLARHQPDPADPVGVLAAFGGFEHAALAGFIGAAMGAVAAHGLKARLTPEMSGIFETAVRFQMYHALALRLPFTGRTPVEVADQINRGQAMSLAVASPDVPEPLALITARAMNPDPERRYGSAREMSEDLRRFRKGEAVLARPVGPQERFWKWVRRRPTAAQLSRAGCCGHWPASILPAAMTAWVRLSTPSFCKIAETCALTVASDTPSS